MLNKMQLRALAREARKLASELCEGTAPVLDWGWDYGHTCAVKHAAERSRLPTLSLWDETLLAWGIRYGADSDPLFVALDCVADANDVSDPEAGERTERVVFPLLALADELENAAERPSAIASDSTAPKSVP